MKDKEIEKLLEVALTLKIPITAVVADVTVTYPNAADTRVTCSKIAVGIFIPPARAKELLLHELGDDPGEVKVLREDAPLPVMVANGACALLKSLENLLQAMGPEDYMEVVADLKGMDDPSHPSSELAILVCAESILSDAFGLDPLRIDLASFIMEWGKFHDHLCGKSTGFEDSLHLVEGEPDASTAENLVNRFRLSRKTRGAQPAVETPGCVRAAAVHVQAFMFRGLIDVLHYLSTATEVIGEHVAEGSSHA